jgi:hypothetical protein
MGPRAINAVLGLWLFFSTFLWPHTGAQLATGWTVGLLAVGAALAGLSGHKWGRSLNAALGGWLIVSAILLPRARMATFWTEIFVGFGLVFLSMLPNFSVLRHRRSEV